MKKRGILLFILFSLLIIASLLFSILISNVQAIEISSPEQIIGINPDNIPNNPDQAKEIAKDFLDKKWNDFLVNSPVGRVLSVFENIMKNFDPIFNLLLGVIFSWSFVFFITLSIWIFLVSFLYRILSFLEVYLRYKGINIILFIISIFVVSLIGISNILSDYVISSIQKADNIMIQIVLSLVFIFAMMFLSTISGKLKKMVSSSKNAKEKKNLEKKAKKNEKELEKVEEEVEDIKKEKTKEKKEKTDKEIEDEIEEEVKSDVEGIFDSEE